MPQASRYCGAVALNSVEAVQILQSQGNGVDRVVVISEAKVVAHETAKVFRFFDQPLELHAAGKGLPGRSSAQEVGCFDVGRADVDPVKAVKRKPALLGLSFQHMLP